MSSPTQQRFPNTELSAASFLPVTSKTRGIKLASWSWSHILVNINESAPELLMPHYNKAPITEALIDLRTALPPDVRFEHLQQIKKALNGYPHEETRNLSEGMLQFGPIPSVQAVAQQKPWGLVFRNQNNNQVAQFRLDGFTFSRLEPYEDWERLRDEARKLWDIYRDVTQPKSINRVALRYINLFHFPGSTVEPEEYLNIFPQVSEQLPSSLRDYGAFMLSLRMPQHDLKGFLLVNEVSAQPKKPGTVAIALDFDLFVENPPIRDEQELWTFFERLRERKNIYFEACITDKTRELIR